MSLTSILAGIVPIDAIGNPAYLTILIFTIALLVILRKPWNIHEAWATVGGAALMLLCGCVTVTQALGAVASGLDVLIFLFALMLLSVLLDKAGFFEWCAIAAARAAKGNGQALYRNVFLVGAVVTALLSLDTTAIILTPIVVSFVQRLKLKAHPFLLACAFVSNSGSLLLPVSNLTNLLFQHAFDIPFGTFTAHMVLPQLVAIAINYALFAFMFYDSIPQKYEAELPEASSAIKSAGFFRVSVFVMFAVLVGYFVGSFCHIPPYAIALSGCLVLATTGFVCKQIKPLPLFKELSWELFPFVIGLFVMIRGVENLGIAGLMASGLARIGDQPLLQIVCTALATAFGSNVVNNVPMSLLSISVLKESQSSGLANTFAAILGCNLGPNLTIAGSLATMLVISSARKRGEDIGAWEFFKIGALATPIMIVACSIALFLTMKIIGGM